MIGQATTANMQRVSDFAARLRSGFIPYFGVSLVALGVDMVAFAVLTEAAPLRVGIAALVAWWIGLAVHYHLARSILYRDMARGGRPAERVARFLTYAGPSLAGLGVTVLIVEAGVLLGLAPLLAKAIAAVVSFQLAFVMRSLMFAKPRPAHA